MHDFTTHPVGRVVCLSDITIPSKYVAMSEDGSVMLLATPSERDALIALLREIADDFERHELSPPEIRGRAKPEG